MESTAEELNNSETDEIVQQIETLESEVKAFAVGLPYWSKYLADKILSGQSITETEIDTAYSFLLEELSLSQTTTKPHIIISYNSSNVGTHKNDLIFTKLENIEGVNALCENQVIDFSPNVTVIYGANGSGKTGYVRLLKKAFYSKSPEEIFPNINLTSGHKSVSATFTFESSSSGFNYNYPSDASKAEFEQYAIFDGKSVIKHLDYKNEFEFRPSGLAFFGSYTDAIKQVEAKLNTQLLSKQTTNDFADLFDGESEIKTIVQGLSAQTKIEDLKKYIPFSEEDKANKHEIEKKYDELFLATKGKDKEIQSLEKIKALLTENKETIENLNNHFLTTSLEEISKSISDCITKEATAKAEGVESFKSEKILDIGTKEWKDFIISAEQFSKKQKEENIQYPDDTDSCLLCQQPLSEEARTLISNYWKYIKSVAEQNAKQAQQVLVDYKLLLEKLNFDLFPNGNTLTDWLTEKHSKLLETLKLTLNEQKKLAQNIILDLTSKSINERKEIKTVTDEYTSIFESIDALIKTYKEGKQREELEKLLKKKTQLLHKEKFNAHFSKFETYVENQKWISKAKKLSWAAEKRKITESEKSLSGKYFNQKYVDTFNAECTALNGNFGIDISHTGSGGTSFRQLTLKGKNPSAILSEGEQKVIAIADFLAEMQLSEINRGIIFDDPVSSLDDTRKKEIAQRLVSESSGKQVVVFTHDLVFVSNLIVNCSEAKISYKCHWVEKHEKGPGQVWLDNTPSHEKEYRNAEPVKKIYIEANKQDCPPADREKFLKQGFGALRTCYEVLVINDLFSNVVQRYNERVSIDALTKVNFDESIKNELMDSYAQCCRYMEGHTHSDKYAYQRPEPKNLNEEIQRYETIRKKIRDLKK